MAIVTVGIDVAKKVFGIQGVDKSGKAMLVPPRVKHTGLLELIA